MDAHKQTQRIEVIDLVRGIAVFFMPMAHTLLIYGSSYTQEKSWLGLIVHFFGKWAGIFLILMGFSYTLSKNNSIMSSIKRGVYLLFLGYLMNFLKFIIPDILGILPKSFINENGWEFLSLNKMIYLIFIGDILQLVGISLLILGFIHNYSKKNKYLVLYIAFTVLILTEFLRGTKFKICGIDYVLDLLWGENLNIYFPFFPWFIFILVGMFFGYYFIENEKNKRKTFKLMVYVGIILFFLGGVLFLYNYEFHMRNYFHTGIGGVMYLLGCNLLFFWVSNFLLKKIKLNKKIIEFFFYCSKNITSIYVLQWCLIFWSIGFISYKDNDVKSSLLLMILFTIATFIIHKLTSLLYEKRRRFAKKNKRINLKDKIPTKKLIEKIGMKMMKYIVNRIN